MESSQEPNAEGSSGMDEKRTQFLCGILCRGVRKTRILGGRGEVATGKACRLHPSSQNAQYTSYSGMERTESSAVSVSHGTSLCTDKTFCLINR